MKILFVTVEMSPLAKVGGLADIAASLPKALRAIGHDVRVIMPRHRSVDLSPYGNGQVAPALTQQILVAGAAPVAVRILRADVAGVPVYLADAPELFDRPNVYGEPDDNARWLAFCDAALAWLAVSDWRPDVLHLNDWHSAFVGSRLQFGSSPALARLPRVYTIHNLAYHGDFEGGFAETAGFDARVLQSPLTSEQWMTHNAMAQGILWADTINTVSPTYADEILTPEYGTGLDPLLRQRADRLSGILNGLDYDEFNPSTDTRIVAPYSATDYRGHATNKAALQDRAGLAVDPGIPLIGMVARLFYQKGADLAAEAITTLLEAGRALQLVVLGTGDQQYEQQLTALAGRFPGAVSVRLAFDAGYAQLIYGGTDLFLMPSRFEPCGLGQLIALRYGSVPVVRRTGGLADTVREWTGSGGTGNGFVCVDATADALSGALARALVTYSRSEEWQQLVRRGMQEDLSWSGRAGEYTALYERAQQLAAAATEAGQS